MLPYEGALEQAGHVVPSSDDLVERQILQSGIYSCVATVLTAQRRAVSVCIS